MLVGSKRTSEHDERCSVEFGNFGLLANLLVNDTKASFQVRKSKIIQLGINKLQCHVPT